MGKPDSQLVVRRRRPRGMRMGLAWLAVLVVAAVILSAGIATARAGRGRAEVILPSTDPGVPVHRVDAR